MFYKSIRFKIAIVYMAILAATLSVFSVVLYTQVSRNLYDNIDTLLRSRGEGIVSAIGTYWATEKLGASRYGVKPEAILHDDSGNIDFATIAQKWMGSRTKDPKLLNIIVQIFDATGEVVASSKSTQGISSVSEQTLFAALQGRSTFDTVTSSYPTKKAQSFRVFITPAVQNDLVEYIVQVASPLDSINETLNSLKMTIYILFPLTVLVTGFLGAFLAKLTLRPVGRMIGTIHDITAENMRTKIAIPETKDEIQKLAETFNEMLARLDSTFTSQRHLFEDLSHELKTPLTIIKGEFEVILKKARAPGEYETVLKSSLEEVDRMTRLVENLLVLASVESKRVMPEKKSVNIPALLQSLAANIGRMAAQKRVSISFTPPAGQQPACSIIGDEKQLKQLFLNILDNAVKYNADGGSVEINVVRDLSTVRVSIRDTGIGIPSGDIVHIFDRFYRVGQARTRYGFGLGLSIVKSIVDAHEGSIKVDSEPGKGTTFTITLPLG